MSKKNQPTTEETPVAVTEVADNTVTAEQPNPPTREERLADFRATYAKLITATYDDIRLAYEPIALAIEQGRIAELPQVAEAKEAIATLEAQKDQLGAIPENIRQYAEIGLNSEIARHQATIVSHKDSDPVMELLINRFWFELHDKGLVKFGKTSKKRGGGTRTSKPNIGDADVWPFSYKTSRTLKDGTKFEVELTEGYIFGPSHNKVIGAKVLNPSDKVIVTTKEGLIMGHLSKALSKSMLLGQSVAIVAGLDESAPAKISETGISGLSNSRTEELSKSIPTPHVTILSNGKNSELAPQTVGSKAQTEKETA